MKVKGWLIALSTAGSLAVSPAFAAQHEGEMGAQEQQAGQAQAGSQQASSEMVRSVQQTLSEQGYDAGPVDGIMGPQTKEALEEFQQAQGLEASGELNEESLSAMGLEREASEFAAGEVREDGASGAQREAEGDGLTGDVEPETPAQGSPDAGGMENAPQGGQAY